MKLKLAMAVAGAAFGAFAVSGPLQHFGVLPQTAVGDASKAMIKSALNMSAKPAIGACDNGWGNGPNDGIPGKSGLSPVGSKFATTAPGPSKNPNSGPGR